MQNLVNPAEGVSCEWHPLEFGVVNTLRVDAGYDEK